MKLVIISSMDHYETADGSIVGWGPTVQEIDELSRLFTEVRHVAVMRTETPPRSALPYRAANVSVIPVPPSGGDGVAAKLRVLAHAPLYLVRCYREIRSSDAVHLRCPANIPMFALMLLVVI